MRKILAALLTVGEVRYGNNFNTAVKDDPLSANAGLNGAAPKYGFTVGVTLRFK